MNRQIMLKIVFNSWQCSCIETQYELRKNGTYESLAFPEESITVDSAV